MEKYAGKTREQIAGSLIHHPESKSPTSWVMSKNPVSFLKAYFKFREAVNDTFRPTEYIAYSLNGQVDGGFAVFWQIIKAIEDQMEEEGIIWPNKPEYAEAFAKKMDHTFAKARAKRQKRMRQHEEQVGPWVEPNLQAESIADIEEQDAP